jgi:hypothetical protein
MIPSLGASPFFAWHFGSILHQNVSFFLAWNGEAISQPQMGKSASHAKKFPQSFASISASRLTL